MGGAEAARAGQHEEERMVSDVGSGDVRVVEHGDAAAGTGGEVNAISAGARAGNDLEGRQLVQKRGGRRVADQGQDGLCALADLARA